jgi:proline iminopeptidase
MFYPDIEPYNHLHLQVSASHSLYLEECGNPDGIPVLFVHGGPGAGCKEDDRCFFDPELYRIIIFDQRGCGR